MREGTCLERGQTSVGEGTVRLTERRVARKLSEEIDRMLAGVPLSTDADSFAAPLLKTACRLSQINDRLPPVPQVLERRVLAIVQSGVDRFLSIYRPTLWQRARPTLWGALMATVLLLSVWAVTSGGQTAWAQVLSVLRLGQTHVEVTPTIAAEQTRAVREPLCDLVAVELLIGRAPALPKTLPEEYELQEIVAVSYPDLPAWISQPFYVELCYGIKGEPPLLCLREYRLLFKEYGGISRLKFPDDRVIEQVEVAGAPGALLAVSGDGAQYTVVWERDGLLLELQSGAVTKEELLQIAQTVR